MHEELDMLDPTDPTVIMKRSELDRTKIMCTVLGALWVIIPVSAITVAMMFMKSAGARLF